jgi:hypothetical protein
MCSTVMTVDLVTLLKGPSHQRPLLLQDPSWQSPPS